jgi:tetratricopeptide (TPR) repeat protein
MNKYQNIKTKEHKEFRIQNLEFRMKSCFSKFSILSSQFLIALVACALVFLSCNVFGAATTDPPRSEGPASETQVGDLKRQLRQNSISPPETGHIVESVPGGRDDDLQKIIAQIRSITINQEQSAQQSAFGETSPVGGPAIAPAPAEAAESNTVTQSEPLKTKDRADINSAPILRSADEAVSAGISDLTLRIINDLLNDPNKSQNLMKLEHKQAGVQYKELAEVLFKSGRFSEAGQCYKRAYELLPADDANLVSDKNWILFQMGNCIEYDDPNTARENFAQLLRTNPSSPWADVAKFRHDLTDWLQKEQPKKLIEELNRKPESNQ